MKQEKQWSSVETSASLRDRQEKDIKILDISQVFFL